MTVRVASHAAGRPIEVAADPHAVVAFTGQDPALPGDGNVSLRVGIGKPLAARATLVGMVGLAPGDAVFMEQVHGSRAALVGHADRGRGAGSDVDAVAGVDALVTRDTDVALVVLTADCVPVLLVDPGASVAAVHAGRRGVQEGVVHAALELMEPRDASAVWAFVGPAIGGCCYEVPDALADEVTARAPQADARTSWGTRSLDLRAAVAAQLRDAGVATEVRSEGCTSCGPGSWFSHRREPGRGRQAAVVCRRSTPVDVPRRTEAVRFSAGA